MNEDLESGSVQLKRIVSFSIPKYIERGNIECSISSKLSKNLSTR